MCPWFEAESIGACISSMMPYVPTIDELERFCFKESFSGSPCYKMSALKKVAHDALVHVLLRSERPVAPEGFKVDE